MRVTLDETHAELNRVLAELLAADIDITVREVARYHSSLKNASAFTRSEARLALINDAKRTQVAARAVQTKPLVQKAATLAEQLAEKSARVVELERQVGCLVASHAACVRAVMRHGGMRALQRFWEDYNEVSLELERLGALPAGAQIIQLE
jgi:hypothetical protein